MGRGEGVRPPPAAGCGVRPVVVFAPDLMDRSRISAALPGARFVQSAGWEIAGWYAAPGGPAPGERYSWGRQPSFAHVAEEHRACREDVILMDMSFMSKFLVQGRDAQDLLALPCGELSVRFRPALVVARDEVDEAVRRTERALGSLQPAR